MCNHFASGIAAISEPDGTATSLAAYVEALQALGDATPPLGPTGPLVGRFPRRDRLIALGTAANTSLRTAAAEATAGDEAAAMVAVRTYLDDLIRIRTGFASVGIRCGDADPSRVDSAQLNVPLELEADHVAAGFGSIWVSEALGHRIVRVDPDSGAVTATIGVQAEPVDLQPADGRMWVRTADHYVAIDPDSNTITATLIAADVGPTAGRGWAVDGALWICDGRRLHRYDPTTAQPVTALELDIDCGQVYATPTIAIAWSDHQDDGDAGTSSAEVIDAVNNQVVTTIRLPVAVGVPVVFDHAVVFPGHGGRRAVVVDRDTWTVASAPDLGRATSGTRPAFDGHRIYIATADHHDLLVVDPSSYTVTATVEPLDNNSVTTDARHLWTVGRHDLLQRRDT
jgi:hypothetical protein